MIQSSCVNDPELPLTDEVVDGKFPCDSGGTHFARADK